MRLQERKTRGGSTNSTGHRELLDMSGALLADATLRRGPILQGGQDVQDRRQESHVQHQGTPRNASSSLEASSQLEAERKYCRSPPHPLSSRGHGTRAPDVSAGLIPVMKQLMKAFLIDKEGACTQNTMSITQCRVSKYDGWRLPTHSDQRT